MSRSTGDSDAGASSAGTKVGSSTPSREVPHDQQTSKDGSTLEPHFGHVHIARAPRSNRETPRPPSASKADRLEQFGWGQNVAEVEVAEQGVPGRALVEPHRVD